MFISDFDSLLIVINLLAGLGKIEISLFFTPSSGRSVIIKIGESLLHKGPVAKMEYDP